MPVVFLSMKDLQYITVEKELVIIKFFVDGSGLMLPRMALLVSLSWSSLFFVKTTFLGDNNDKCDNNSRRTTESLIKLLTQNPRKTSDVVVPSLSETLFAFVF